jgi:hypothetical protein
VTHSRSTVSGKSPQYLQGNHPKCESGNSLRRLKSRLYLHRQELSVIARAWKQIAVAPRHTSSYRCWVTKDAHCQLFTVNQATHQGYNPVSCKPQDTNAILKGNVLAYSSEIRALKQSPKHSIPSSQAHSQPRGALRND